jgi:molybdenum cofactor cytidylyltransferase
MGGMSDDFEASRADGGSPVAAIILAAGLSARMGRFKLTLPWEGNTVVGRIAQTLLEAGLADVIVVTGHRADEVTSALAGRSVRSVYNPEYQTGQMLSSVQVGLRALGSRTEAAMLCLGDQPQIQVGTVLAVLDAGRKDEWQQIVVPSYQRRAGHPILLPRSVWQAVWNERGSLRDVLREHAGGIRYVEVDTATVLADLDTPRDYDGSEG